jgi:uncharacterized repeat protein (TIGR01451 family)
MQATSTRALQRLVPHLLAAVLAAVAALLLLQASPAAGATLTQTFIGNQPGTPNIGRSDLQYFLPSGAVSVATYSGTLGLALDGRPAAVYCLELGNPLNQGTVTSNVNPVAASTNDLRALLWILQTQLPTGAVTADKQQQAAIAQVAIWVMRGQLRAASPTNDPATNDAVGALIATARAQSAVPASLTMIGSAGGPGKPATIAITAKPGATVALAVTAGSGTLSSSSVTVGPDGKGSVSVSNPGNGTVVSGTTAGDGTLIEIDPVDGSQNTATTAASELQGSVAVSQTAATTSSQVHGSLRISKSAPASARALSTVRYRITVRNPTPVAVRNAVLRDRIPSGMSFRAASRAGRVESGRIRWSLGTLRPGARRTVTVWLFASASVRGNRTNVATVSATGVRTVKAEVSTFFQAVQRQTRPAVTG